MTDPRDTPDDAELVAIIRSGDPSAWGTVFDRHRDRVWQLAYGTLRRRADAEDVVQATFLKAVESIDQLRDPSALRPWLLSIARRRALDTVRRVREVAHDPVDGAWADTPSVVTGDPLIAGLRQDDIARLVRAAFDGLEPRDRAALELAERFELSGDELAAALDVTRDNAYALVHNARARFEASVASFVIARVGRADCADLDELLHGWEGELTPLLRKRLNRHLERCATCGERRRREVSAAALLGLVPVIAITTLASDQSRAAALEAAHGRGPAAGTAISGSGVGLKLAAIALGALLVAGGVSLIAAGSADGDGSAERAVASAPEPPGSSPPAQDSTPTTSVPTPTTTDEPEDFCTVAAQLEAAAAPGPASAAEPDMRTYLATVNEHLQRLVAAADPAPTNELSRYADAYQEVIDAGIWRPADLGTNETLAELSDVVEAQVDDACDL